jgi:hypothetical protein
MLAKAAALVYEVPQYPAGLRLTAEGFRVSL